MKTPITVNANSTQTVTNNNGKAVNVGPSGPKKVDAKTKVTTDTNNDVGDEAGMPSLAIEPLGGSPIPPDQSEN